MAGYGFAVNPKVLARQKLTEPADWTDLTDPRLAGQIVLPSPARVGFAPPLVEIVLQAYGWNKGWALWSEIAGNAVLLDRGSTFITDEVSSGRRAVGVTIDFFAASALANGAPLKFIYPPHNGVNPAHIAITVSASHTMGAKAFVEFVLSSQGQKILEHPDIRKLPVRPAVYGDLPSSQFNAFDAAKNGGFTFNEEIAKPRMGLTTALFEQFLGVPHDDLAVLWARVHGAEAKGLSVTKARLLLSTAPLSESESLDAALQQNFHDRIEGHTVTAVTEAENSWRALADKNRFEAKRLLNEVGA
jgi:ABC-type glycerol-3-phosphate transport system substrate-binding protein